MISKVRGTQDILPARFAEKVDAQAERLLAVETCAREVFGLYGVAEIRTPIIEHPNCSSAASAPTPTSTKRYTLRDMASGEQKHLRETELIEYLKER